MKKIIIISISGLLIGSVFACYMFFNINETVTGVIEEEDIATAFQVGVYSIYDNAKKMAEKHEFAYVYEDDDKYRVFLAIYQDNEIIKYLDNYYKRQNIDVYLKEMSVNNNFLEKLKTYEELLKKTNDNNNYISANKNILEAFKNTL